MKKAQDKQFSQQSGLRYIRFIDEVPMVETDDTESDFDGDLSKSLRVIICMSSEGSRRLLEAQYVQSDIGFKRIAGFQEFEIGGLDRDAQISKTRHTADDRLLLILRRHCIL